MMKQSNLEKLLTLYTPIGAVRLLLVFPVYFFALVLSPVMFSFHVEQNGYYFLSYYCAALLLVNILLDFFSRPNYHSSNIVAVCLYTVIIVLYKCNMFYNNEYIVFLWSLVTSAFVLFTIDIGTLKNGIFAFIVIGYLLELVIGISQFGGGILSGNYKMAGTFGNTGTFTVFMVLHFPLIVYIFLNRSFIIINPALKNVIVCSIWMFTICIVYINGSRNGFVMLSAAVTVLFIHYLKGRDQISYHKKLIVGSMALIALAIVGLLFFIKLQKEKNLSAEGRLLGTTVVLSNAGFKPWVGIGVGKFTYYYPQWQADYFKANHDHVPMSFFLSAGESYLVFNEYLVVYKEVGLLGISVLLYSCYKLFVILRKRKGGGARAMLLSLIMLLVCAFFFYPLHVTSIFFLCLCSLVLILKKQKPPNALPMFAKHLSFVRLMTIAIALSSVAVITPVVSAAWKWQRSHLVPTTTFAEQLSLFDQLNQKLGEDGKFMTEYASILSQSVDHRKEGINMFEKSCKTFITVAGFESMANLNEVMGNNVKALACYYFLSNLVPNRFSYRISIAKLHLKMGDTVQAKIMAIQIVNMPIKIPSSKVDAIRHFAMEIIKI